MSSSSIHKLNADKPLSTTARRLWYFLNYLNNHLPPSPFAKLPETKPFRPDLERNWNALSPKSSPSRALSDLFWMQLPWARIQAQLGSVHILDVGCGSGRYGLELQKYSGTRIASYTGIDESPHASWPQTMSEHPFVKLLAADSGDFQSLIPASANMFISQSAIEHFPADLTYFKQVRDFLNRSSKPWLQVHLFPSAACLRLYRYHGVRQYTPRTIAKITAFFPDAKISLFGLGGATCNQLHWEYISDPVFNRRAPDRRETETEPYREALRKAMQADASSTSSPSFYALVIEGNTEESIFRD